MYIIYCGTGLLLYKSTLENLETTYTGKNITWQDYHIGKDDVEGAFSNLKYSPESALLICTTIQYNSEDIKQSYVMVTTAGVTGRTITPGTPDLLQGK